MEDDTIIDDMLENITKIVMYGKRGSESIYGKQIDKKHILLWESYNKFSDNIVKVPIKGYRIRRGRPNPKYIDEYLIGFYYVIEKLKTLNKIQINKYVQSEEYKMAIKYYSKLSKLNKYYYKLAKFRISELYYYTDFVKSFKSYLKSGYREAGFNENGMVQKYLLQTEDREKVIGIFKENKRLNRILKVKPILDKYLYRVLTNICIEYLY